jgi:nicotinamidase-related amidase
MQITRDNSLLLIVDIQSKLAPHIAGNETLTRRTEALLAAAKLFGVPKLLTEHCPGQIGRAIEPLRRQFGADEIFEKTAFGATGHPEFIARVQRAGRRTIVITGMEAHVCVLQTALGLRAHGYDVCIVADAAGSRSGRLVDREHALQRMAQAGCLLAGTETVLYEWTADASDPRLREVLALVKSL